MNDLPDITDQELEAAMHYTNNIVQELVEDSNEDRVDPAAVMFNLYMESIAALHYFGWSREELVKELNEEYGINLH